MEDTLEPSNSRNSPVVGKQSSLPPKIPLSTIPSSYADYTSTNSCIGSRSIQRPLEGHKHHTRTHSESFLIDEHPSWVDDLLNEHDEPVTRGSHRRSSSDSFMYSETSSLSFDNLMASQPYWGSGEFDFRKDSNPLGGFENRGWEASFSRPVRKEHREECTQDYKRSFQRREFSHGKNPHPEMDNKRAKQQFAQRSRVRKLHYISELERTVQALQVEGLGVSSELEFLNQHSLMIDLENKALSQRLDSLAQEHLVKCLQHEMLEREIARLRALWFQQQQQQQQQQHSRRNSKDLDSLLGDLSLKNIEPNLRGDPENRPLHI